MRNILIFLLVFSTTLVAFSQPQRPAGRPGMQQHDERREVIESRRISYITKKLSLSPEEAKVFWPIYHEYNRKVEELSENIRNRRMEMPVVSEMSEEEAAQFVEEELHRFERAASLRREYTEMMLEVISVEKVAMLFEAEKSFNRMLFREAQRRHRPGGRDLRD